MIRVNKMKYVLLLVSFGLT